MLFFCFYSSPMCVCVFFLYPWSIKHEPPVNLWGDFFFIAPVVYVWTVLLLLLSSLLFIVSWFECTIYHFRMCMLLDYFLLFKKKGSWNIFAGYILLQKKKNCPWICNRDLSFQFVLVAFSFQLYIQCIPILCKTIHLFKLQTLFDIKI